MLRIKVCQLPAVKRLFVQEEFLFFRNASDIQFETASGMLRLCPCIKMKVTYRSNPDLMFYKIFHAIL